MSRVYGVETLKDRLKRQAFDKRKREILLSLEECVRRGKDDPEAAHSVADDRLLDLLQLLGQRKAVKLFRAVRKYYA